MMRETMGLLMMAVLLIVCAGRADWVMGWALVIITALWIAGTALATLPRNPELLAERMGPRKGSKTWDTVIISLFGTIKIVEYVVAGLDVRYGWSAGFPVALQVVALVLTVLSYALIIRSIKENAFFALTVRIQTERGHTVISSGPYRFVRHPGYVGAILSEVGIPAMLGSWFALALGVVVAVLFVVRTVLEDRALILELPGYRAYTEQVRYRLVPGVW